VAVVVTGGTLTVFDPSVAGCAPFTVSKGQSFVEPANHVHLARNDSKTPATLYVLYLGVPKSAQPNIGTAEPAGCNA
jgi:quercetin dioxygenase-like cupin family protein